MKLIEPIVGLGISKLNVLRTVISITERSPILKELIESGEIGIVGGIHDISTGVVTFYPETFSFK